MELWYAHAANGLRRNLPHVQYELYDACLARDPVTALNKMGRGLRCQWYFITVFRCFFQTYCFFQYDFLLILKLS